MRALRLSIFWILVALVVVPPSASAASLEGTWSGRGTVNPKDGPREAVRCRVTYRKESPKVFGVSATCATTSVKIRQTGKLLKVNERRYVGDFYNPDYDVSGRVRVILRGSSHTLSFTSARGRGSLTMRRR
jgi:hypothetical protein